MIIYDVIFQLTIKYFYSIYLIPSTYFNIVFIKHVLYINNSLVKIRVVYKIFKE